MPLMVNNFIFNLIPQRSPWLLRPLLRSVFGTLQERLVVPRLKAHAAMVNIFTAALPRLIQR